MSQSVDERVVEMRFDNQQFERGVQKTMGTLDRLKQSLKFDGTAKGFENLDQAAKKVSFDGIAASVASLQKRFSTFGIVGMRVIQNLTDSVMGFAKNTVGFATDSIINGGKRRAMNIENAHFQLQGLLKDEEKVQAVMDDAMQSVDGTAYAYDEAAKAASQFAASGIEAGEQMQSSLRAITGVAAMTNSEYEGISQIFTTVAGNGRLMGDQLLQLSSRGLNAAATLADYMTKIGDGAQVTETEVRDLVSKGEISFELFAAAMDDAFGEHAKRANETFTGAMSNVKASLARIGAEFVSPLIVQNGPLVEFFNVLRERVNDVKASIGPLANTFTDGVTAMANAATKFLKKLDVKSPLSKFEALSSPWDKLSAKISSTGISADDFQEKLKETAKEHDIAIEKLIEKYGSLGKAFSAGKISGNIIVETLKKFAGVEQEVSKASKAVGDVTTNIEKCGEVVDRVINGEFGNGQARIEALTNAGYDYATVQNLVNEKLGSSVRHISDLTEAQLENADQLSELSEAQLENQGYTKEQIKAIKDLAAQAEKAGTPINELIASIEKPSGRELLIDSFRNALSGLGKILASIKNAWSEIFPSKTSEQLYGIIEGLHSFSTHLAMTDETADKLKRTFKGLFSLLSIISTITGGALRIGVKLLSQILGIMDVDILSVTASVGDSITAFRDWLKTHSFVTKAIEKLVSWLKTGAASIRNWFGEFKALPNVQRNLGKFQNAFEEVLGRLPKYFGDGAKRIGEFIRRTMAMDSLSFSNIKAALEDFKKNVIGYFLNGQGLFDGFVGALKNVKDDVKTYLDETVSGFAEFRKKVGSILGGLKNFIGDNFGAIVTIALGFGLLATLKKISDTLKEVTKPIKAFTGLIGGMTDVLKTCAQKIKAEAFYAIAKSIAILVGSIALLTQLDLQKTWSAVKVLGVLAAGLLAFSAISGKIGKVGKVSLSLTGIAGAIFILILALKAMENLDSALVDRDLKILGVLGLGLTAFAIVLSKAAPKLSKGSLFLLSFASSIKLLTSAMGSLSELKLDNPTETLGLLLAMIAGLALVAIACKNVKFGAAVTIVAIAGSLHLLIGVLEKVSKLNDREMKSHIDAFIKIFGMFALLMAASRLAGKNAAKMGVSILAMSGAILIIVQAIRMMTDVDPDALGRGLAVVSTLLLVFSGVMALSQFAGRNAVKAGAMLLLMSGAIFILSGVIALLSQIEPKGLGRALGAVVILEVMFGAIIAVTKLAQDCKNTLIVLSATIAILAIALGSLSMIDPEKLIAASLSLSLVMGMFALMTAATSKAKKAIGALVAITLVVGALAGILYLLAGLPTESALSSAGGLSILLLSLSAAIAIIGKSDEIDKSAYVTLGVMTLVVAGLAAIIGVLAYMNVGPVLEIAASLSLLLVALSGACWILSKVGGAGHAAFVGVGALVVLIAAVGALMVGIGALVTYVPDVEQWLNAGLPILEKIGYGLGAFFGNIIGGFTSGMTSGMPQIGENLSAFMESMKPFFDGVKAIDAQTIDGVKALAETILILTAADLISGLTSWLVGGSSLADFAEQLVVFGKGIAEFSKEVDGNINEYAVKTAARAGKVLAEVASILPNSGGVVGWWAGNNDIDTFGTQITVFGKGIVEFSKEVDGNINEYAVKTAARAGKALAEVASILPNSGGVVGWWAGNNDIDTFGTQITVFGKGIAEFSKEVDGNLNEYAIKTAARAGKVLAEVASILPNSGGVVGWWTGDNDIDTFGTKLTVFGKGIVEFSKEVDENINEYAIKTAARAGKALAEVASILPNSGGVVGWWTGDNDIDTFGTKLTAFGKGIVEFSEAVTGHIDASGIEAATKAGKILAELAGAVPKSGGFFSLFTGEKSISGMAEQLGALGEGLTAFSNASSDINADGVEKADAVGKSMLTLIQGLPQNIPELSEHLGTFGKAITNLSKEAENFNVEAIQKTASTASDITNKFREGISSEGSGINSAFTGQLNNALSEIQGEGGKFQVAGSDIAGQLINGVSSGSSGIEPTFTGQLNNALSEIQGEGGKFQVAGSDIAGQLINGVSSGSSGIEPAFTDQMYEALSEIQGGGEEFQNAGSDIAGQLTTGFESGSDMVEPVLPTSVDNSLEEIQGKGKEFQTVGSDITDELITGMKSKTAMVESTLPISVEKSVTEVRGKYSEFYSAGSYLVDGFTKGISENSYKAAAQARAMAKSAEEAAKNQLDEHSPSKVFDQIGKYVAEGFANGIHDNAGKAAKSAEELAEIGTQTAKEVAESLKNSNSVFSDFVEKTDENGNAVEITLEKAAKAFKSFRNSIKDSIKDATGVFDAFEVETDITGKQLLKNLQSQITGISEWASNIQVLAGRGLNEGLLKALSDMGPSGAKYANALVTMTDAELKKLNALYLKRIGLNGKTANQIAASFLSGGKKVNNTINATLKKTAEAFTTLRDSIKDSIKDAMGVFDEFEVETDVTGKQLLKNLKSQITGITEWASNIQILADRGVNKGLLKVLSDMGPSGAKYINALVTMSDKELKKLNKLYKKRMGLNGKTAEQIAETFVEGGKKAANAYSKGVSEGTKEAQVKVQNTGKKVVKELVDGITASMDKTGKKLREVWEWPDYKDAVKNIKTSLNYGKGAFQQFVNQYLSATKNIASGNKALKAAAKAITEYGKKLYKESEYYKEDTKNIKKHKKELTSLQEKRENLKKQLKEAQKSNTKASKARAKTLKKELKENKKSIDAAKKQIKKDEKEIEKHTKEVFQNLRSTLSESVSAFLDPLKISLESGVDLFSKFESNSDLYEADKKKLKEQRKSLKELEKIQKEIQNEICKYDDDNTLAARKRVKRLKEQLSEVESSIEEAKQNIEQTENDMESHSQVTVNSILENMQSQISGVKKWQKNLQKLAGRGLSQGLLDKLKEMGTDGVDYVDQFMKMTSEELKKANDLFAQSENLTSQTLINNFKDSIKRTKNWADGLQKMAEMGFGQDLLEKLGAMGVEGDEYVNAFLSMTPEQVAQFNKEYADSLKLPDVVADQVISSYAYAGIQSANAFTSALSELSKKGSEENKKLVGTAIEIIKVIGTILHSKSKKTGEEVCHELAKGIIEKKKSTTASSEKVGNAALKALKSNLSSGNGKRVANSMVQGLKKGLTDGKSGVVAAAQKVAQEAFDAAKVTLGIKSPSRKFAEIGKYVDAGFVQGMVSGEKDVCKTAANVMNKALREVSDIVNSDMDVQPTIRPVLDLSDIQNGAAGIHKMMDGYAVSGAVDLAGVIAKGMDSKGSLTDTSAMNAIKKLQDTLTGLLDKPSIEQHNTFSISGSNPKEIANEVSHILQQQVERRSTVWG